MILRPKILGDKKNYTVSQKTRLLWLAYNFDIHQPILILFGKNVAKKVSGSQMCVLYFPTSPIMQITLHYITLELFRVAYRSTRLLNHYNTRHTELETENS